VTYLNSPKHVLIPVLFVAVIPVRAGETKETPVRVPTVLVPGAENQPGGPDHDFRIGVREITNHEFARFLNDAHSNPEDPRGAYLYHDTDSGDVFIHHQTGGEIGTEAPSETVTTRIYHATVGRIRYDAERDEPYTLEEGFEAHPVVGVSWYGAAKFCNWLTLSQGMPESARLYTEGPTPDDWRPITTDSKTLLALPGYRLPMDGGLVDINPSNEWLKAAARRPDDVNGNPVFGATYGFGRQSLTAPDANYLNNGDTADNRTTPAGYFDGVNPMHIGGTTLNTANGYGLFDLCGNAAEWIHDGSESLSRVCEPRASARAESAQGDSKDHLCSTHGSRWAATRGGHFFHVAAAPQLRNESRELISAESTFAFVGFRIAQSITPVPLEANAEDEALTTEGPVGGPFDRDNFFIELRNNADYTHDDFTIALNANWLDIHQLFDEGVQRSSLSFGAGTDVLPQLMPPHSSIELQLTLNDSAYDLLPGKHTATLTIRDNISNITIEKVITLTLSEPLIVDGPDETTWAGHYCNDFTDRTEVFTITNTSARDMPWHVTTDKPWLSIATGGKPTPSGTLPGLIDDIPATIDVHTSLNDAANNLPVGHHQAIITFTNTLTNQSIARAFALHIHSPVNIEPVVDKLDDPPARDIFWGDLTDPLEPIAFAVSRCDTCAPDCVLDYEASANAEWLTLEPDEQLTGQVPEPGVPVEITATINAAADNLIPGQYDAAVSFGIRVGDTIIDTQQRLIRLRVNDPIVIDLDQQVWNLGCNLDPDNPPTHTITLTNRHRLAEIGVTASPSVPWIELPELIQVLPGAVRPITISVTESAAVLLGEHEITLTFLDTLSGHAQHVSMTAAFSDSFCVMPTTGSSAYGPFDGIIEPSFTIYRIHNDAKGMIEWSAASDRPWLTLNGNSFVNGLLDDGQHTQVIAAIEQDLLPTIDPGIRRTADTATITFNNLTTEQSTARAIIVHRIVPRFALDESTVPANAVQPNGPTYTFLMTRTHITNQQFVDFLNDALEHLDDPKGHHLFFDTTTGDLYLNDTTLGAIGSEPKSRTIRLFSPATAGHIEFADGVYRIINDVIDYSEHPVSGVSWYGAVKYANWLTLDQGLSPDMRCYSEDTHANPSGWRPTVLSDATWSSRDLNDGERRELVTYYRGFRLPMDDGYNNPTPTTDTPDDYNEWYKAGAWNPTLNQNTRYGFGRDTITGPDANFRCSGDPFEDSADCNLGGTSPAGYFDGSTYTAGGIDFLTNNTTNAFGLMDMTGNLHHWLNGRHAPSTNIDRRTLRGGSWNDVVGSDALRIDRRPLWAPPTTLSNQIGFRLVRTHPIPSADANRDGVVDAEDLIYLNVCHRGPDQSHPGGCSHVDFNDDGRIDLRDAAEWFVHFGHP
jgi:formylglycine-generating enzyme required for sulfatase activity